MVSYLGKRRRTYGGIGSRPLRRRRFSKMYRRRRRGSRFYGTTFNKTRVASGLQYRGRKLRPRMWRASLWRSTRHLPHYRSNSTTITTPATPAVQGSGVVVQIAPLVTAAGGSGFWQAAGGAVELDTGEGIPTFRSDLVIRGGKIGIAINFAATVVDVMMVKVWHFFTKPDPNVGLILSPQPLGWDPTISADVTEEYGRLIGYKEAMINGNDQSLVVEARLRTQKIDIEDFLASVGSQNVFVVQITNMTSATAVTAQILRYHNLSFTGDAIA